MPTIEELAAYAETPACIARRAEINAWHATTGIDAIHSHILANGGQLSIDAIVEFSGLSIADARRRLNALERTGRVRKLAGGVWQAFAA